MSLKQAVLGLVIERPGYGYELIQRLDDRIGGWRPSRSAVYPALRQLNDEGSLRKRGAQSAHRSVTWYEATDQGREHFRTWLHTPSDVAPLRDATRIKIAFASIADLPRLIEVTREQEQHCLDRIEELTGAAREPDGPLDDVEWTKIGHAWLDRTEVAHLATTIEALQDARRLMKKALRRHELRARRSGSFPG